ncbi:hypothetical protein Esti_004628 [Eimeria stiedai]
MRTLYEEGAPRCKGPPSAHRGRSRRALPLQSVEHHTGFSQSWGGSPGPTRTGEGGPPRVKSVDTTLQGPPCSFNLCRRRLLPPVACLTQQLPVQLSSGCGCEFDAQERQIAEYSESFEKKPLRLEAPAAPSCLCVMVFTRPPLPLFKAW